jgi:hypothetical protein
VSRARPLVSGQKALPKRIDAWLKTRSELHRKARRREVVIG